MQYSDKYLAYKSLGPKRIPHWEHWSCPAAESYLAGIDLYDHPRQCRLRLAELYPQLELGIPPTDDPWPRPRAWAEGETMRIDEQGKGHVRWGDVETAHWDHGSTFHTPEDVFAFSPLAHADMRQFPVLNGQFDYTSVDTLRDFFRTWLPADHQALPAGSPAPDGSTAVLGHYLTMFMWPMLVFGWDLFLQTCLDPRIDPIMDEFAELNRRLFTAQSQLPVNFIVCHDDIFTSQGPVCSPAWMRKHIFPRYEEYWSILKAAGKTVIFMADGCADAYADDVMACGACGIITEPYTDYKAIARRYPNAFLAGEGDNRILMRNRPDEIRAMVESMVETAKMTPGYMMCVGNHIPWDIPPEAIKLYFDLSKELAVR